MLLENDDQIGNFWKLMSEAEIIERLSNPLPIAMIFLVVVFVIVAIVKLVIAPAWRILKQRKQAGKLVCMPQFICIFFLIIALNPGNPYGYYQFLRWICFFIFLYLTACAFYQTKYNWVWVLGINAIIYNPFFPVPLERDVWTILNLVSIVVLAGSVFTITGLGFKTEQEDISLQDVEDPKEK